MVVSVSVWTGDSQHDEKFVCSLGNNNSNTSIVTEYCSTQCVKVLLVLGAQALPQPQEVEQVEVVNGIPVEEAGQERSYRGVLSDYDYRRWTVGRVEREVARIVKVKDSRIMRIMRRIFSR